DRPGETDLDGGAPGNSRLRRHSGDKPATLRRRQTAQFAAPGIKLVAMQPIASRDHASNSAGCKALLNNPSLLFDTPPPPTLRALQNLRDREAGPINWQITWQSIHNGPPQHRPVIPKTPMPINVGSGHRLRFNFGAALLTAVSVLLQAVSTFKKGQ